MSIYGQFPEPNNACLISSADVKRTYHAQHKRHKNLSWPHIRQPYKLRIKLTFFKAILVTPYW